MRPRRLTERQRSTLEVIVESIRERGRPPTLREIGARLDISSTNGVREHLQALVDKGYIERQERSARGIRLVDESAAARAAPARSKASPSPTVARVPVLDRVAAGAPLSAARAAEDYLLIDGRLVCQGDVYALRARGDGMADAGIHDGDYVFVRPHPTLQPGDLVVALVGDETTVRRFYAGDGHVRLQPADPSMDPIIARVGDPGVSVLGKVAGVLRFAA